MELVEVSPTTAPGILEHLATVETRSFPKHESLGDLLVNEATKPGHTLIVALDEASLVCGYVLLSANSVAGRIVKVAVDPSRRRQGIGRSLMHEAMRRLRRSMTISLHVSVHRSAALALYQSLGFRVQETRRDYYRVGEDAYYMELERDDWS